MNSVLKEQLKNGTLPNTYFTTQQAKKIRAVKLSSFVKWYDNSLLVYDKGFYLLKDTHIVLKDNKAVDTSVIPNITYDNISFCCKYLHLQTYQAMWLVYEFYCLSKQNASLGIASIMLPDELFEKRIADKVYYQDIGNKKIIANLTRTQGISSEVVKSLYSKGLIFCEQISCNQFNIMFPLFDENNRIVAFECYSSLSCYKNEISIIAKESAKAFAFAYDGKRVADKSVMEYLRLF